MDTCKVQLFCMPYAGGTAAAFDNLKSYLSDEIAVTALDYAGHGTRRKEEYYPTFDAMVSDMASKVNAAMKEDRKIVLFGYSMGSVVAYEMLARKLLKREVIHLFLAAHEAPCEHWDSSRYQEMDDLTFAKKLVEFGGFDRFEERFLENKFFMNMYFRPIREDYRLISNYTFRHTQKQEVDTTLFYSPQDITTDKIMNWSKCFQSEIAYVTIGRNHFFIKEYPQALAEFIEKAIQKAI